MVGRLVHTADFERVLATPPRSRSAHFAVHHVASGPAPPKRPKPKALTAGLSTGPEKLLPYVVDNSPKEHWLGSVVPKRHAKRSVTRTLLKRQIRAAMSRHQAALAPGLWLVRLRAPFLREQFPSAASRALRASACDELERLFVRAAG